MDTTRREFIKTVAALSAAAAIGNNTSPTQAQQTAPAAQLPWYRRTLRWGQTNITEADVARYDIPFWRSYWKRTCVQGVVINAGGIFAYYPSKFELHHRAVGLGDRDLYGDLAKAAHDDGLVVFARMDSSRAFEPLYRAHPDWFAVDINGQVIRAGDQYQSCINSPYYTEWLPGILREIIERSHPEGFTDNSWAGLDRNTICYCPHCREKFRAFASLELPQRRDWNDKNFQRWIEWSYSRRREVWDYFNKVTRDAGGKECIWVGMTGGDASSQSSTFRDLKGICERADMIMLDNQSRRDAWGIQDNAVAGKLVRSVLGPDKVMPESMAMYQHGRPQFRLTAKPAVEARMWMLSGMAGGIQPWWHHVSAYQEDRRAYNTAEPIMKWHQANERYLINRRPIAPIGIAWSQRNVDFFGRDNAEELVDKPFRGFCQALLRARIPFVPVHLDNLERDAATLTTLILPNIGVLTDDQVTAIKKFTGAGKSIIATGSTGLMDNYGAPRETPALADLLGITGIRPETPRGRGAAGAANATASHSYLRLSPEMRGRIPGPHIPNERNSPEPRHPLLAGFDDTDILPFGGTLGPTLTAATDASVLATFIPSFPAYPPETAYMRTPSTNIPAITVREAGNARIVTFAADIDRRYALDHLPDHATLLANAVRWAARNSIPLDVKGPGLIDCELYTQSDPGRRLILHLVNLTNEAAWRAPADELIPIGPVEIRLKLPEGAKAHGIRCLVSGNNLEPVEQAGWISVVVEKMVDHEVLVVEL